MKIFDIINAYLKESENIEGWFYPLDIILIGLLERFQYDNGMVGDVAELGVWKGKSLIYLAQLSENRNVTHGIDIFEGNLFKEVSENILKYAETSNIRLHKKNTIDCNFEDIRQVFSNKLRILHIDAGHEYHEVLHSLNLFGSLVHENGIIIMDDYSDREFPGVQCAVLDYCGSKDNIGCFQPFLLGANKVYLANEELRYSLQQYFIFDPNLIDKFRIARIRDFDIIISNSRHPQSFKSIYEILNKNKTRDKTDKLEELARHSNLYNYFGKT